MRNDVRKIRKYTYVSAIIFAVGIFALSFPFVTASANSAPKHWYGSEALGTVITGDTADCPLEVKHETLTFDIGNLPKSHYNSTDEFSDYDGRVTAEYTFYNPEPYDLSATLMFPFGKMPSYSFYEYDEKINDAELAEKYDIKINGEVAAKRLRHSYSEYKYVYGREFDTRAELNTMSDERIADDFYKPDAPVTVFRYRVRDLVHDNKGMPRAVTVINTDKNVTRIITEDNCNIRNVTDLTIEKYIENDDVIAVKVIGEPLETPLKWNIYENNSNRETQSGRLELIATETTTYGELVTSYYDSEQATSETDFYNAALSHIRKYDNIYAGSCKDIFVDLYRHMMRWYEYELNVPANSTVINSVTAPIYPDIDDAGKDTVYGYKYLLSPARFWHSFGKLDIIINTDLFIANDGDGFTLEQGDETVNRYTASLDGLPDEELVFYTCADGSVKYPRNTTAGIWTAIAVISFILIAFSIAAIATPIIVVCVYLAQKKKAKK